MTGQDLVATALVVARWLARVGGLFVLGLFGLFAIVEGFDPAALRPSTVVSCALVSLALAGLLVAWRWELTGGLMVVSGMVAFGLWGVVERGRWGWSGWVFWSVAVLGVLFLMAAFEGQASKATPA